MKNAYVGGRSSSRRRPFGNSASGSSSILREMIRGKRLIVVDDSIVRGNTQRALIRMLREAGAVEVHARIASPPVKWPCFYGIDFASPAELIANAANADGSGRDAGRRTARDRRRHLGYISLEGMIAATEQPASRLCCACFDGQYPIELPSETAFGQERHRAHARQCRACGRGPG